MSQPSKSATSAQHHALRDAARLGLTTAQLREVVDGGFVTPSVPPDGIPRFSFAEIKLLRSVGGLLAAGIPLGRVLESLRRLRRDLDEGELAKVTVTADGARVVAYQGLDAWDAESGQRRLDFTPPAVADPKVVRFVPRPRAASSVAVDANQLDADAWFEYGCELEELADPEAGDAYRKALELDPRHTDALLNLGRWVHEAGDLQAAEDHYRRALTLDPDDAIAAFNLGVALQDLERHDDAVAAYEKALELDPACSDAYYNLAGLYQDRGDEVSALRFYKRYRALTDR